MSGRDLSALLAGARESLRTGDNQAALAAVSQVLDHRDSAQAWNLKGDVLQALSRLAEAAEAYARAASLQPKHAPYWHDLGRCLLHGGRIEEAASALARARALSPQSWEILCDLGTAQLELGSPSIAAETLSEAVTLKPDAAIAHFNHGTALREAGHLDEAESAFKTALIHMPHLVPAMVSLISLTGDRGRLGDAEGWFAAAARIAPQEPQIHQARALALLRHGHLQDGFRSYEWRFAASRHGLDARPFTAPRWQGEPLAGRDILIWTEQGLGDEILASGMFAEIIASARSTTIECSDRTAPLFQRSFPEARVVVRRDPPDAAACAPHDFQVPASSLGGILRPNLTTFPQRREYIYADPHLKERLRQRYRAMNPGARIIGISWDSSARHGPLKRLPLAQWRPILNLPGNIFVSLQYGVTPDHPDILALGAKAPFADEEIDAVNSLDASAAQVAAMDLVITVSNTTAHLAGAQGVPVWTLVPDGPGCFWYWFRNRPDSPWYPSMRIFRQPTSGAWSAVIEQAAQAIVEMPPPGGL